MATADLTTAEGILRELWDVRVNKAQLTPDDIRSRQKAAWRAARKLLGVQSGVKAATTAANAAADLDDED